MIHQRFELNAATGAHMDSYLLARTARSHARGAVLVCPGGAYLETVDHEAEQIALRFNALGLHSAVVRYSCGPDARWPNPLAELAKAVALFRENAEAWQVDAAHIGICGFSAGGHLCAMMSTRYAWIAGQLGLRAEDVRPDCAILCYPVTDLNIPMLKAPQPEPVPEAERANPRSPFYAGLCEVDGKPVLDFSRAMCNALFGVPLPNSEQLDELSPALLVSADTVPGFVWTTATDGLVLASNALNYVRAMWSAGVPCELHMFAEGNHGLSLADATVAEGPEDIDPIVAKWFDLAAGWLKKRGFLP